MNQKVGLREDGIVRSIPLPSKKGFSFRHPHHTLLSITSAINTSDRITKEYYQSSYRPTRRVIQISLKVSTVRDRTVLQPHDYQIPAYRTSLQYSLLSVVFLYLCTTCAICTYFIYCSLRVSQNVTTLTTTRRRTTTTTTFKLIDRDARGEKKKNNNNF